MCMYMCNNIQNNVIEHFVFGNTSILFFIILFYYCYKYYYNSIKTLNILERIIIMIGISAVFNFYIGWIVVSIYLILNIKFEVKTNYFEEFKNKPPLKHSSFDQTFYQVFKYLACLNIKCFRIYFTKNEIWKVKIWIKVKSKNF